jgi:hypothetical protein
MFICTATYIISSISVGDWLLHCFFCREFVHVSIDRITDSALLAGPDSILITRRVFPLPVNIGLH